MTGDKKPFLDCVPYRNKRVYWAITAPILLIMLIVVIYLGSFSLWLPFIFLLFYIGMSTFQAFCCAYQDCPYVGGFCPAVLGILPASYIAKWLYGSKPRPASKKRFEQSAAIAVTCWAGMILLPLYWLSQISLFYAIGYVLLHVVYTIVFGFSVCPHCALRPICPGGKLVGRVAGSW